MFKTDIVIKGTLKCDTKAEQGNIITLNDDVKIEEEYFPDNMIGLKVNRYSDNCVAIYNTRGEADTLMALTNTRTGDNCIVMSDTSHSERTTVYVRTEGGWTAGSTYTYGVMNNNTVGAQNTLCYMNDGKLMSGITFLSQTVTPTTEQGNDNDVCFIMDVM